MNKITHSRRNFIKKTGLTFLNSSLVFYFSSNSSKINAKNKYDLIFKPVKANTADSVVIPKGFNWKILIKWGDPIFQNSFSFDEFVKGKSEIQKYAFGDNNDGMHLFEIDKKNVLVVNNESTNIQALHNKFKISNEDIKKSMYAHGISIVEIFEEKKIWKINKKSKFNKRITVDTPIKIVGPAKNSNFLKTKFDPNAEIILGTFNNCGFGKTPWGTYLTCEENFNYYFSSSKGKSFINHYHKRYGIKATDRGYRWSRVDERFDISKHPNEPNRFGYIVEIDPKTGASKKLSALGRFKHENAELVISPKGKVVVYMGDDERGEYIYKFVSKEIYKKQKNHNKFLHFGDLYAAIFNNDGTGKWVALKDSNMSREEISIFSRVAASKVGATRMDRPEWIAVDERKSEVYCCLTNNKYRGIKNDQPVNSVNPRKNNKFGHIIKWKPKNNNHDSNFFDWNIFLLAGNPDLPDIKKKGTININTNNKFNSPDGLKFSPSGMLWVQTDGNYTNKGDFVGMGNNQMLLANTNSGAIERFLVGPKECEVTGLTWSQDRKTMFVGIQHPGEKGGSSWPDGRKPSRSAIITIKRDDDGVIG